jgi:hypothetical protein
MVQIFPSIRPSIELIDNREAGGGQSSVIKIHIVEEQQPVFQLKLFRTFILKLLTLRVPFPHHLVEHIEQHLKLLVGFSERHESLLSGETTSYHIITLYIKSQINELTAVRLL